METPDLNLAPGLTSRPCSMADAGALVAVLNAMEIEFDGEPSADLEDITADWSMLGFVVEDNTMAVFDGDVMVGQAELGGRRVELAVHPEHRGRGIGTALLLWSEATARTRGTAEVFQMTSDRDLAGGAILERHGYVAKATAWILRIDLADAPSSPVLPEGYTFAGYVPGRDERALYDVIEGSFRDIPDRDDRTFEEWAPHTVMRSDFDPSLVSFVVCNEVPVGALIGFVFNGDPWVDRLGVLRDHRKRGIARALLERSFKTFRERGFNRVALNTNSDTGALSLYQRAGMHIALSYTRRAKSL